MSQAFAKIIGKSFKLLDEFSPPSPPARHSVSITYSIHPSGGDRVEAYSAGSKPSGIVNPKAIAAMKEIGYDLSTHDSKSLDEVKQYAPFDAVVTMGCGDACPWMPAKK